MVIGAYRLAPLDPPYDVVQLKEDPVLVEEGHILRFALVDVILALPVELQRHIEHGICEEDLRVSLALLQHLVVLRHHLQGADIVEEGVAEYRIQHGVQRGGFAITLRLPSIALLGIQDSHQRGADPVNLMQGKFHKPIGGRVEQVVLARDADHLGEVDASRIAAAVQARPHPAVREGVRIKPPGRHASPNRPQLVLVIQRPIRVPLYRLEEGLEVRFVAELPQEDELLKQRLAILVGLLVNVRRGARVVKEQRSAPCGKLLGELDVIVFIANLERDDFEL